MSQKSILVNNVNEKQILKKSRMVNNVIQKSILWLNLHEYAVWRSKMKTNFQMVIWLLAYLKPLERTWFSSPGHDYRSYVADIVGLREYVSHLLLLSYFDLPYSIYTLTTKFCFVNLDQLSLKMFTED